MARASDTESMEPRLRGEKARLRFDPGDMPRFKLQLQEALAGEPFAPVAIREMFFEADALLRLPDVLRGYAVAGNDHVFLVMDATPMQRAGKDLKQLVVDLIRETGLPYRVLVLGEGQSHLRADMLAVEQVMEEITYRSTMVALGSGTITDIVKHAAYLHENGRGANSVPFVVCQTANSVGAYTSDMAVLLTDGVKRTLLSRYCDVLICDLQTLADAPLDMTRGGLGDCCARFVAQGDWYVSHILGLEERYSELPLVLLEDMETLLREQGHGICCRSLEAAEVLAKVLALVGISGSIVNMTTPLSGFEHVMSHVLDMQANIYDREVGVHGCQVGVASIFSAAAYEVVLEQLDPTAIDFARCYPAPEKVRTLTERAFALVDPSGRMAAECWRDYQQKLEGWHENRHHFARFLDQWPVERGTKKDIERLVGSPAAIGRLLRAGCAPADLGDLFPPISEEEMKFAFMNAHLTRKRFTIGDLLFFLGWMDDRLWRRVRGRARAVAGVED